MRKIIVGIDISKEKLNLCVMEEMRVVREDEIANTAEKVSKWLLKTLKTEKIKAGGGADMRGIYGTIHLPVDGGLP